MLIEGTHFARATHRPEDAGWKALARGLSDIAAMGGAPRFCLVSLALAKWTGTRWVDRFYDGLLELAAQAGSPLIGGDLARTDRVLCDIVVCGAVPRGRALRRDGARAGDRDLRLGRGWEGPLWALPPAAERHGGATSGPNRASRWAAFCANVFVPPPPWT